MSSRVFVAPQAGRLDRSRREDDEPWGTTASQSQFRAYDPTEAKNCRGATAAPFEPARPVRRIRTPSASLASHELRAVPEGVPLTAEPSVLGGSSATLLSNGSLHAGGATPSAASGRGQSAEHRGRARGPMGMSTYQEDQRLAQEARLQHFPHRDEFAPRSKRLLYELAHARCSRDAGSTASGAASVSCFTVASTAASGSMVSGSVARSASEASLPRLPTADSQRICGGIARRRKELDLRAPNQWEADRVWLHERLHEDGPAGITTANHVGRMYNATLRREGERINSVTGIFSGQKD